MIFRRYEHGSEDYLAALELRRRVLREPLGLTYSDEDLAREVGDIHLGAFEDAEAIGTLMLTPSGRAAKMRQVAVAPERQGEGVGRKLVEFSEHVARESGFEEVTLHAQKAVAFYERLGYCVFGERFEGSDDSPSCHAKGTLVALNRCISETFFRMVGP